jgi:transposase
MPYIYGMGKKPTTEVKESLPELKKLLRAQKSSRACERVNALIRIKEGRFATRQDVADSLGVHIRTLERWMVRYGEDGISGLLGVRPRRKGSKIITPKVHEGLAERLNDPSSSFRGYWEARQWVQEQYGVEVTYHGLRAYMIRHFGSKVKRPRRSHVKKEPGAIEAFFKTPLHSGRDQKQPEQE